MKIPLTRLMYMVKMIHNVSSFFNDSVRIASFLVKITFQAIISCKNYITSNGTKTIWNQPVHLIEKKIKECIDLKDNYRLAYTKTRDTKFTGEVHRFEFSQQHIFGNFDSFCVRLNKILHMFDRIRVFTSVFESKLEDLLQEEVLTKDKLALETSINILKGREYDFLDFRDKRFDSDLEDFQKKISFITQNLKTKLEKTYANIWTTHHAFQYLNRFEKLSELLEITDIDNKQKKMLATFKSEMELIQKIYKKYKNNPPVPRNYPDESGGIYWIRSLISHLRKHEHEILRFLS